jgi:LysM repeat protein
MIEVIYKEEKPTGDGEEAGVVLPRNIRQIGLIHENYRIYVEDYVYTFLGKLSAASMKEEHAGKLAVLTGEVKWQEGVTYLFVRGAILTEGAEAAPDHVSLKENAWEKITEEAEKYFPHQDVVGWSVALPGISMHATETLTRAHVKYFGGEKILFLMDPVEHEEAFFRYENSFLVKQSGFYLYYEKNQQMQSYMLAKQEALEEEHVEQTEDTAVQSFRRIIKNKKESRTKESGSFLSYAATACLVISIGAVGVRFYQNYQLMQNAAGTEAVSTAGISELAAQTEETAARTASVTPASQAASAKTVTVTPAPSASARPTPTPMPTLTPVPSVSPVPEPSETPVVTAGAAVTLSPMPETSAGDEPASEEETTQTAAQSGVSYVVRPGDSLFQISLDHYGTIDQIEAICQLNGLSEEEIIYPGQIILLP